MTTKTDELKPCPFNVTHECVIESYEGATGQQYYPTCNDENCPANIVTPQQSYATKREAINAWNTRNIPMQSVALSQSFLELLAAFLATFRSCTDGNYRMPMSMVPDSVINGFARAVSDYQASLPQLVAPVPVMSEADLREHPARPKNDVMWGQCFDGGYRAALSDYRALLAAQQNKGGE